MSVTLGEAIWTSVKPIIKVYMIIGTGFFLAKKNLLTVAASRVVSDIVLTVLLPCLSFNKIVANISDSDIKNVGIVCLTSVMIFGTGFFFAFVVRTLLPVPKKWRGGILAGGTFPNISDLPIAILQTMDTGIVFTEEEGNKGVAIVIIFLTMFLLCVFNLGGFRLIEMDFDYKDEENCVHSGQEQHEVNRAAEPENLSQFSVPLSSSSSSSGSSDERSDLDPNSTLPKQNKEKRSIDLSAPVHLTEENIMNRRFTNSTQNSTGANSILTRTRSIDLRELPAEDVGDVIREYSNVDQFGNRRFLYNGEEETGKSTLKKEVDDLKRIVTSDATVDKRDIENSANILPAWLRKIPGANILMFFLKNCLRPCSLAVIVALAIAFIPWVKALFVTTTNGASIKQAPDGEPPLNFIMEYTSYIGAASVPFGLILLGASLGRLKVQSLYPGFWKSAVCLVLLKQCVMPIFGVLWCDRLVKAGWLTWENDSMLLLVIVMSWGLPTMTTIIYFTASYTPPLATETVQMDCVSFFLMLQYPLLIISMPFLVTYFIMVQMPSN